MKDPASAMKGKLFTLGLFLMIKFKMETQQSCELESCALEVIHKYMQDMQIALLIIPTI